MIFEINKWEVGGTRDNFILSHDSKTYQEFEKDCQKIIGFWQPEDNIKLPFVYEKLLKEFGYQKVELCVLDLDNI